MNVSVKELIEMSFPNWLGNDLPFDGEYYVHNFPSGLGCIVDKSGNNVMRFRDGRGRVLISQPINKHILEHWKVKGKIL